MSQMETDESVPPSTYSVSETKSISDRMATRSSNDQLTGLQSSASKGPDRQEEKLGDRDDSLTTSPFAVECSLKQSTEAEPEAKQMIEKQSHNELNSGDVVSADKVEGKPESDSKPSKSGLNKPNVCLDDNSQASSGAVCQEAKKQFTPGINEESKAADKSAKYRCPKCSRVIKDKRLMDNHSCDIEPEDEKVKITILQDKDLKSFTCKECNFSSSGHGFEEHLMCHLMIRPYQCLYCKECFINRKEISRHVHKAHNGAKMSCALRALRKAKALIKEVTTAGVITFMAKVAGKVPLEKDPEKKKQEVANGNEQKDKIQQSFSAGDSVIQNDNKASSSKDLGSEKVDVAKKIVNDDDEEEKKTKNDKPVEDRMVPCDKQLTEDKVSNGKEETSKDKLVEDRMVPCDEQLIEDKVLNGKIHEEETPKDEAINKISPKGEKISDKIEEGVEEITEGTSEDTGQTEKSAGGFSKLREVLEQGASQSKETEPTLNKDSDSAPVDSGLKIVASYSLHDDEGKAPNCSTKSVEPNFIMEPPPSDTQPETEEVLSFLGPEQPFYKNESEATLMLPPPPLQPAPSHAQSNGLFPKGQEQSLKNSNFFICGFNCLFSSMSTSDFREHTMNFHSSETFFPCYYCGHRSPNENDLVRHISNHTQTHNKASPLLVCGNDGCRFGTNMVSDYISHIKVSHSEILEPLCYSCGITFPDLVMLQSHVEDNVIHSINCPHCPSKATERRAVLDHITSVHPGKAKMVSVAKQLICNDRKVNNYEQMKQIREMLPSALTTSPGFSINSNSVVDHILSRHEKSSSVALSEILSHSSGSPSPSSHLSSPVSKKNLDIAKSPSSEGSDFSALRIKEELEDDFDEEEGCGGTDEATTAYTIDENGIRRRIYVPMSERQAENYRCRYCTFIARDLKRLNCHERSHGMPPTRKERFKCMFCPQGFDSEMKFRLHITCHPGLIKFLLYRCKKCEFDTNQKHTMVKHITCNRDRKHRGFGPVEEQYTVISRSLESRVLECERCNYMTRHKIHMAIHYQRKHNILRDKGEFTIEGLTPTDTPVSSYDSSYHEPGSSPIGGLMSPDKFDGMFDFAKPASSTKKGKEKFSPDAPHMTSSQINERNELFNKMVSQQAALQPGQVLENQMRKFKCPICKYLLPKAADLKNHVKRHSEIGQITLVMFRCKYCSCMSTARELLYEHLSEKHLGKPIALVKKIVAIDTTEVDKSFAETSMEESLDLLEESLHKELMTSLKKPGCSPSRSHKPSTSTASYEQLFVIPEGGETFSAALQCPKCPFRSHNKSEIIEHVNSLHPEVKVIGSDEDVDKLALETSEDIKHAVAISNNGTLSPSKNSFTCHEEVLIVPDDQVFKEPALCSRCDFYTMLRRDMVIHLQKNHPDISVMGRNSYPVQVSTMGRRTGLIDESCVVGSGSLDAKIRCLYENYGTQMKCLICGSERPKKFFIHVHILRHLNIYLWKCAFCAHRGLQKYKMVDHIKKIHPGKAMSVRYIRVNVEAKVSQFLSQFNVIKRRKSSLDEGTEASFGFSQEDSMDQASNDSTRQKSPGPSNNNTLGSEDLDEKIRCLYDFSDGVFYKCIACCNQFQRKFAVHRHIIISHLKVALLACGHCGHEGVEKHQMVDHNLACHKTSPVSIQTLYVDLSEKVSEFLAKVAAGELINYGEDSDQKGFNAYMKGLSSGSSSSKFNDFKFLKSLSGPKSKVLASKLSKYKSTALKLGSKLSSAKKSSTCVDPGVIMLGREALDRELSCLYQLRPTGQIRCLVCRWEFPRKYPLHRHIMLKHLKLNLVKCPYCPFEGVEKYNVTAHIKEDHKDMPVNIKYCQPDVKSRVKEFVNDMANLGGMSQDLIQKPRSRGSSPLVVPKVEKKDEDENEDDIDREKNAKSGGSHGGGLVVAMFGKKKPSSKPPSDIVVKTEVVEEENYEEGSSLNMKDDEEEEECLDEYDEDNYDEDDDMEAGQSASLDESPHSGQKHSFFDSYAPGSYRSPAGGKPKALDVITKIKVLKSKEGPITKFYCEQCKFTSLHRSNIVRHIYKIHEKYQTHTCPVCNYQTLSLMLMQKHVEKEHPGVNYKEDSFTLNPPRIKPRSKPVIGPLSFQKKRQKLISKKLLSMSQANVNTGSAPKQYACAYCHYETNTQEDILKHTRVNHSQAGDDSAKSPKSSSFMSKLEDRATACWDGSKKAVKRKIMDADGEGQYKRKKRFVFEKGDDLIQCGHCETKETSLSKMQEHINWDHPGLPYQAKRIPAWRFICKSCSVKTMATSKMKYHLNRHVNYRPYTCTNCGAFFPSPDQCRRHSRSQGHEEQYTYVRNVKKENRVEELLEGTRKLALQIQEEASKDPDFDISQTDSFIAKFQDSSTNLKRSAPTGSKKAKKAKFQHLTEDGVPEEGGAPRKTFGKSPQTVGVELDVTVKCYRCEFTASNVSNVKEHHIDTHPDDRFLWTELDRGFTCDSTGEALPDCETVPSSSLDVGYTTRMTLGSSNSPMRFKCKTCDFSSCVIQAMKSHLKSHQPKGFICPYCSRSFSGKEKLMRHQYCLHKGQPLWVIHLRRAGVAGSTSTVKGKGKPAAADKSPAAVKVEPELSDKESTSLGKQMMKQKNVMMFNCSECPYTTESLYNFRLHTAERHDEFQHKVVDDSGISTPPRCFLCLEPIGTEADLLAHIEMHSDCSLCQCGYCDFTSLDRVEVQRHLESSHDQLEPRMSEVEVESREQLRQLITGQGKELQMLLNLNPEVVLEKIPDSVLCQLGYREVDESGSEEDSACEAGPSSEVNPEDVNDDDEEGRLMVVEGADEQDTQIESDIDEPVGTNDNVSATNENVTDTNDNASNINDNASDINDDASDIIDNASDMNDNASDMNDNASDAQRSLGDYDGDVNQDSEMEDAQDEELNPLDYNSDMMIIQFGGVDAKSGEIASDKFQAPGSVTSESSTLMRSKDSTLLSAQQEEEDNNNGSVGADNDDDDDDDDDLDEVNFDNDITLASPLPMISLGDGVSMSPSNAEEECSGSSSPDHMELLLDV